MVVPTQETHERPPVQMVQAVGETARCSLGEVEAEVQVEGGKNESATISGF
jgi:hypothetical protein